MSDKLNTHYYDGKLDLKLLPELDNVKNLSKEDKLIKTDNLLKSISDPISVKFLKRIINDFGKSSNKDPTNNLIADDLVCLCEAHKNNKDFIESLEFQLKDMQTGFCPQGRTHRLFQLLIAFSSVDSE